MIKMSIQAKVFTLCMMLVLITATGISTTYYILTKQDKQRESRQRIQIAFDIILDDFQNRVQTYTQRFEVFLQEDVSLKWAADSYNRDKTQLNSTHFITSYLAKVATQLKNFGSVVSANHIALYGADKRLLVVYRHHGDQETFGVYAISSTGENTYLPMEDPSKPITEILLDETIPDHPLPSDIAASYEGSIPDTLSASPFNREHLSGIRITVPVYQKDNKVGVLVGEFVYTQSIVARYAALTKTAVNFFAENRLSVGTLPAQTELEADILEHLGACEAIMRQERVIEVFPATVDDQDYYQGQCALRDDQGIIGAITVSLSQNIEKQEIRKILTAVLVVSGASIGFAFGLSWLFSRNTIHSIQNIVNVMVAAAKGDLRKTATAITRDEIGMLATKLNQMIAQLHTISVQVQGAANTVNTTADTILEQMDDLIMNMEQQSTSVDSTTESVEKITHFIDAVARNTNELLVAADQILSSIRETLASIEEVTTSTGSLATNLHLISSSVEQVNQTTKQIAENTGGLEQIAQHTAAEIHQINGILGDVSHNADQTQQLARETMEAATRGHSSVEASIQGMAELKAVVSDTAQIIQEVSSWGEQVSSILDIVDEITEQTSLLSLNASIISAQAGVHGRGFAVVANEIKELATRTKISTKEIGTLVYKLQKKTEEGVKNTIKGLTKADHGVQLANAVQEALTTILERATRSSKRAVDTAQVIQQATESSQVIQASMHHVTERVSQIRTAIQDHESDMEQVVLAVENISGMAEQVNHSSIEQTKAAEYIAKSMEEVTEKFGNISKQTEELKQNSRQVVSAMRTIESTTGQILRSATTISGDTVNNLVQQSNMLQQIVRIFKVSSQKRD